MKTLQIRHVPDDVHRRLKARAAEEGMSLSELALAELRRSLDKPTRRELFERLYDRLPQEFLWMRELILSALWRSPEHWTRGCLRGVPGIRAVIQVPAPRRAGDRQATGNLSK